MAKIPLHHPEQMTGEIFLGYMNAEEYHNTGWISKRHGNQVLRVGCFSSPVFISFGEIEAELDKIKEEGGCAERTRVLKLMLKMGCSPTALTPDTQKEKDNKTMAKKTSTAAPENNPIKVIKAHTRDMYDQMIDSVKDAYWDNDNSGATVGDSDSKMLNMLSDAMKALSTGNINTIRQLFVDGYTPMLVPMEEIDSRTVYNATGFYPVIHIHVYHNGKLIGVVIDSEITY